jgi:hypothetical protein
VGGDKRLTSSLSLVEVIFRSIVTIKIDVAIDVCYLADPGRRGAARIDQHRSSCGAIGPE